MLGFLAGVIWDLISYNDFQIPRAAWALATGSAD